MPKDKPIYEESIHYGGQVKLRFYPVSHRYYIDDAAEALDNKRLSGVTTYTGVMDKSGVLIPWAKGLVTKTAFGSRRKKVDGKWTVIRDESMPGVLKAGIPYSAEDLDEIAARAVGASDAVADRGRDVGSFCHDWMELFLRAAKAGEELPPVPNVPFDPNKEEQVAESATMQVSLQEFVRWFKSNDVEVIGVEEKVYSRKYGFCGMFDSICRVNGKVYLIDFKTTNPTYQYPDGVYPEYWAQTAGYHIAYVEENPEFKFDGHMVWNASKKVERFSVGINTEVEEAIDWFKQLHAVKTSMKFFERKMSKGYSK